MLYTIDNGILEAVIESKGAELKNLRLLENSEEFMWSGDPEYWGKTSPVLFPFVGGVKDGVYTYRGTEYRGSKHGFARDMEFQVVESSADRVVFRLSSGQKTLEIYPFEFDFYISYSFEGDELVIGYRVVNKTEGEMYFSLGGHPAFATPTEDGVEFSDYYLEFEKEEEAKTYTLEGMYIADKRVDYLEGRRINLRKDTFIEDAIMFEGLASKRVSLKNKKNKRSVTMDYTGFPFIAFWNVPGADYVCIEPWCGIADFANTNGKIEEKYGIERLTQGEEFSRVLRIQVSL